MFRNRIKLHQLGIVGIRGQAALWAQTASQVEGWAVRACYHPDRSRHQGDSKFPQTDRLEELTQTCDAILIASPTPTHLDLLCRLSKLFSGPVLVEKPILCSLRECQTFLKTVPSSFLEQVVVTHNWRFTPWVQKIKEIFGRIDPESVISADFHLMHDFAYKPSYLRSWRSRQETHPVGPAETQGIHLIDLVHHLLGKLLWISGSRKNLAKTGTAPDTTSMLLMTQSGVACSLQTSYAAPASFYARLVTSSCILTQRDGRLTLQERPTPPTEGRSPAPPERLLLEQSLEESGVFALKQQLEDLSAKLAGTGSRSSVTAQQGMANIAVLEGLSESLQTGRPYFLEESPLYAQTVAHTLR